MMECDAEGPLSLMITKIWMDPHAGEVAVGRVYSVPSNMENHLGNWSR